MAAHVGSIFWLVFAIVCTSVACIASGILIWRHLRTNEYPALRLCTIRILLMVPIYAVEACCAYAGHVVPYTATILKFLREMYEAVVIFSFVQFVLVAVGGPQAVVAWATPLVPQNFWEEVDEIVGRNPPSRTPWDQEVIEDATCRCQSRRAGENNLREAPISRRSSGLREFWNQLDEKPWMQPVASRRSSGLGKFWSELDKLTPERPAASAASPASAAHAASGVHEDGSEASTATTAAESEANDHKFHHLWPFNKCCPAWSSARAMVKWCVRGALSYVITGIVCAIIALCLSFVPHASDAKPGWSLTVSEWALSITQSIAIVALADMAHNVMDRLRGIKPMGKFISVKLVVFFSFWQGLVILLLEKLNVLDRFVDPTQNWHSTTQIAAGIQNLLVCFEMAVASIAHHFVFPPDDFKVVLAAQALTLMDARSRHGESGVWGRHFDIVDFRDIARTVWDASFLEQKPDSCGGKRRDSEETTDEEGRSSEASSSDDPFV